GRLYRLFAATVERAPNLVVQVNPVSHQRDARIVDTILQRNRLRHHHHRQRFSRPLRVPDDAARAFAVLADALDSVDRLLDGEILLVTGDLFLPAVKHNELTRQLDQSLRPEQAIDRPILFCTGPPFTLNFLEFPPNIREGFGEKLLLLLPRERFVDELVDLFLDVRPIPPACPELKRRSRSRVLRLILIDRHEHLRVNEEPRDVFAVLIAQVNRDGGFDRVFFIRPFAFDHDERNAVDEKRDVRAAGLMTARALDLEFCGAVEDVVFGILPVNIIEREALHVAVNFLFKAFTQRE